MENTEKILNLLNSLQIKATFFVLGWVAERFPQLINKVHSNGHEIACHGYFHQLIYAQSPSRFRSDIRRAKEVLEEIIGEPVSGYRAPSFSITKDSLWALDILIEEGFEYDSSIFPIHHDRYGIPGAERFMHKLNRANGGRIWEFPLSTLRFLNMNLPIAGGGYLRFFPCNLIRWGISRINEAGYPAIIYFHPWEIDRDQPKINAGTLTKIRHYTNISKVKTKLTKILSHHDFSTARKVIDYCSNS